MVRPLNVRVFGSEDDLANHAADLMGRIIVGARQARGRATVALCGGSTPRETYRQLARQRQDPPIDWDRVFLFFGDERFVPPDDLSSNFAMVNQSLLLPAHIPDSQVFQVPTGLKTSTDAAEQYQRTLSGFFGHAATASPPRFDLIVLGLGEDGHTASLFPGSPALTVEDQWVVSSLPGTLPPAVERVTFTFPVLNAAREVLFLVSGPKKAETVRIVVEGETNVGTFPASGVAPKEGQVTWLLDEQAGSKLSLESRSKSGQEGPEVGH